MDKDVIISFENFGFQYTAQAEPTLYDINLQIRKGEKVLIAGPSGCGKSTLAHCINGLIPYAYKGTITGTLTVDGKSIPFSYSNGTLTAALSNLGTSAHQITVTAADAPARAIPPAPICVKTEGRVLSTSS